MFFFLFFFSFSSSDEFPCAVCRTGVESNSIFCKGCKHWVHKRLTKNPDYRFTWCQGAPWMADHRGKSNLTSWWLFVLRFYGPVNPMGSCRVRSVYLTTHLLGRLNKLEVVASFCYLGDISQQPVAVNFQPQHV